MRLTNNICQPMKMNIPTAKLWFVLLLLTEIKITSTVQGSSRSINEQSTLKLIWLPSDQLPPKHILPGTFHGPSWSQLPYIDVSPSRAPKQLLGARYLH